MITEEQRQERRKGIFASDVSYIMEGHAVELALKKLGELEPEDEDEDPLEIEIGHKREGQVLDLYEEKMGAVLQRDIDTLRHREHTYLGAHLDAIWNERAIDVEAKVLGDWSRKFWGQGGDEVPSHIIFQTQTQLLVSSSALGTPIQEAHVPVMFLTMDNLRLIAADRKPNINIFIVPGDKELQEYIIERTKPVWDCISQGKVPSPQLPVDTLLLYGKDDGGNIQADYDIAQAADRLAKLRWLKQRVESREVELTFQIQAFMKTAGILKSDRETLATWKNDDDSTKFDAKAFQKEYPELWDAFQKKKSGSRRFMFKKKYVKELTT